MGIFGRIVEGDKHAQIRFMAPLTESFDWVGISKHGAPRNKAYRWGIGSMASAAELAYRLKIKGRMIPNRATIKMMNSGWCNTALHREITVPGPIEGLPDCAAADTVLGVVDLDESDESDEAAPM